MRDALADAGLSYGSIKAAACSFCYAAPTAGQRVLHEVSGGANATGIPVFNLNNNCSSASSALFLARQLAPRYGCIAALGFEEMERGLSEPFPTKTDPNSKQFSRLFELGAEKGKVSEHMNNFTSDIIKVFAKAATEYQQQYGATAGDWAQVAFKNRVHGQYNTKAMFAGKAISLKAVADPKRVLVDPITSPMSAPTANGAAAAIVVTEKFLKTLPEAVQMRAVEIAGQSMVSDLPSSFTAVPDVPPFWALAGGDMAMRAAKEALAEAGVTPEECGIVEVHDCFSPNEIFMYEALGLCERGQGVKLFKSGQWTKNSAGTPQYKLGEGKWVVNASGGLESKGHPIGATGLGQCWEIVTQLRGEAGIRQIESRPVCGLQHNFGFNGGAVVTVYRRYENSRKGEQYPLVMSPKEVEVLRSYRSGWCNFGTEYFEYNFSDSIEGRVPQGLKGTFFRNGPGLINVYGTELAHPIDGDGLIVRLSFPGDGSVNLAAAFVQTFSHKEEREAKQMLYPGQMGTRVKAGKRKFRDQSHTNVYYWGGKLLSCHEYTLPHALDPQTLKTVGPDTLGEVFGKRGPVAAHFRVDQSSNTLVVFGFRPCNPIVDEPPQIHIAEFTEDWKPLKSHVAHIAGLNYVHDIAVTPNYYVCQMTPFVKVDEKSVEMVISGEKLPGEQMRLYPDMPCRLVIIDRVTGKLVAQPDLAEKCHIYHFGNVWEEGTGKDKLVVQAACLPAKFTMEFQERLWLTNGLDAPSQYFTMKVNLKEQTVAMQLSEGASCEFPTIHPALHSVAAKSDADIPRFSYLMANGNGKRMPFNAVIKHDALSKEGRQVYVANGFTLGEPIFAPRKPQSSQDDGWVIVQATHPEQGTEFHILDATKVHEGPLCRLKVQGCQIPNGFHGTWSERTFTLNSKSSKL